jgi:hypothetical protein
VILVSNDSYARIIKDGVMYAHDALCDQEALKIIVNDIFSEAKFYKVTRLRLRELLTTRVWDSHLFKRIPRPYKTYIRGYVDCMYYQLMGEVEFKYYIPQMDKWLTPKQIPDSMVHKLGIYLSDVKSGFFWKDTDKMY